MYLPILLSQVAQRFFGSKSIFVFISVRFCFCSDIFFDANDTRDREALNIYAHTTTAINL